MRKRIKKSNKLKSIYLLICIIFSIIIIYSVFNIVSWFKDNQKIDKQVNDIINNTKVEEVKDNSNTEIIKQETKIPETSIYWTFLKTPLLNVNFDKLKNTNSDTVGWINVSGTNINYPVVQTKDNTYYLTHSFDKTYNKAGWVFMDYRNKMDNINKNTIIYAHSRVNNTMFGSLNKTLKKDWYNNKSNHMIRLSTENINSMWQIFSVYTVPNTNDYIKTVFNNDDEFLDFINLIKNRSKFDFATDVNISDNIITLSTCYKTNERVVVHAKLIKKETKN